VKKYIGISVIALTAVCFFLSWRLYGQMHDQSAPQPQITLQGMSPQELQMMRHDLTKQKQKLIAENLPMTESEAVKFWAVYQKYSDELNEVNNEKFAMLHSYAQNYRSMSNDDAMIFMRRWLELDEKAVQLRSKYLPLVRDALPGKKAATFFQLDERISMMINLEFASQLPLLHGAHKS
jgi:cell division protein FtsB